MLRTAIRSFPAGAAGLMALAIACGLCESPAIAADDGDWVALPPPSARDGHVAAHDPLRERMLVFGGRGGPFVNDLWALSLGDDAWSPVTVAGTPPMARYAHTAIYDPVGDRLVVFGGDPGIGPYRNDVWQLSLAGVPTWTGLTPTGTPPSIRRGHSAVYDPIRQRMVVFGGGSPVPRLNDVWALSLSGTPTWTPIVPAGVPPSGRDHHAAVYDPARDRMLVFGGFDNTYLGDVWELSFSGTPTWTQLAPAGTPPAGRFGHAAILDPGRDRMLIFGGRASPSLYPDDLWELSLAGTAAWSALSPGGTPPQGRINLSAVLDPDLDRMLVFGGYPGSLALNDLWQLALPGATAWSLLAPAGDPPGRRAGHSAMHDPVRSRMLVFGGFDGTAAVHNDAGWLALTGEPTWSTNAPSGTPPSARSGHSAIYDPIRDRMVAFAGFAGAAVNEVWTLSLSPSPAWSQLVPAGAPPTGRSNHSAIYDPVRDRMVVFGGYDGTRRNDLFELTLGDNPTWSPIVATGLPPTARYGHSAIYDPGRDRMIVFAGYDGAYRNDVWELSLAGTPAWTLLGPSGTLPGARFRHTAIYDPYRDRMVLFGGYIGTSIGANDAWGLSLAASPSWTTLGPGGSPPSGRYDHTAIYDPAGDRMVVFGGSSGPIGDAWTLVWGATVDVPPEPGARGPSRVARVVPNPSNGEVVFELQIAPIERARSISVFDARGALVWREELETALEHPGRIAWNGRGRGGTRVSAGLFFVRLDGVPRAPARRFVMLD